MEHHFNTNLAKEYGIEEAILLHHFYYWIAKNATNEKHFHDGLYWTYNSKKAYSDFFQYMNETKIFRVIKHLEELGIIVKGNYNPDKWDKTNWYALTKLGWQTLVFSGYDLNILPPSFQNDIFDSGKMNDGALQNEQPIPNNNTNNNKVKKEIDKSISKKDDLFEKCWVEYRRKGSKKKSKEYWNKLSNDEKQMVLPHIKAYISTREITYQKDFERYLRDKIFTTIVFQKNMVVYDPTKSTKKDEYIPQESPSLFWNDYYKCYMYIGYWDGDISDGYTNEDRPNGAKVTLNNGRGVVTWNSETKKWIKQ